MENKIYSKLALIQSTLKAPKGQFNSFGKYKYRSAEDILEAVKPICIDNGSVLTISDTLEYVGDRYYIKATATLTSIEDGSTISNTAYAREEESKKGMDGSQITGTASSYARKYAMNGLFAIDDTKDADTDEHANQTKEVKEPKATKEQITQIKELFKDTQIPSLLKRANVKKIEDIPMTAASDFIKKMQEAQAQA